MQYSYINSKQNMSLFKLNNKRIKVVFYFLFLSAFTGSLFSQETFEENFDEFTPSSQINDEKKFTLHGKEWSFAYVDCKYSNASLKQCVVLRHNGSGSNLKLGYMVTPEMQAPQTFTFGARLQYSDTRDNILEVQISEDGGPWVSVGTILISHSQNRLHEPYRQYSIDINSTSNNVRMKILRKPSLVGTEHSDINIIIDNVSITTTNPTVPSIPCSDIASLSITQPDCGKSNGSISLTPNNASENCSFIWKASTGEQLGVNNTLMGISAGQYSLEMNCNKHRCDTIITMIEAAPQIVSFSNLATVSTTQAECGKNNGSISLTLNDPSKTCSAIWRSSAGVEIAKDKNILTDIPSGQYTIEMDCGCYISDTTVTVIEAAPQIVSFSSLVAISTTQAECGKNNGSISLTLNDLSKTCPVVWRNNSGVEIARDKNILTDIPAGQYTIEMNCGCYISDTTINLKGATSQIVPLLWEDFSKHTKNTTGNLPDSVTLNSGVWEFYYVHCSYNSVRECASLQYHSSGTNNMGYMITPILNAPQSLSFDARLQNFAGSNYIDLQISTNGGPYISIDAVKVTGTTYKRYTVPINSTSNNVRIKFLRSRIYPSESSNYNIMIDNLGIDVFKNCDDDDGGDDGGDDGEEGESACKGIPQIRIEEPTCDRLGTLTLIPNTLYGQKQYNVIWRNINKEVIGTGLSISNIEPGTYYAEISWDEGCSKSITIGVAQAVADGHGLTGTYNYTDGIKQQIDPVIDFQWESATPPKSVVWEGCLEIPCDEKSGEYIFYIPEGGKLYIDGKLVIGKE